jgi:hypothetical protein
MTEKSGIHVPYSRQLRFFHLLRFLPYLPILVCSVAFYILYKAGLLIIPVELSELFSKYLIFFGTDIFYLLLIPIILTIITYISLIIRFRTASISQYFFNRLPAGKNTNLSSEKDIAVRLSATPLSTEYQKIVNAIRKKRVQKFAGNKLKRTFLRSILLIIFPFVIAALLHIAKSSNPVFVFYTFHGLVLITFLFILHQIQDAVDFKMKTDEHILILSEKLIRSGIQSCGYIRNSFDLLHWFNSYWFDVQPDRFRFSGKGYCFRLKGYTGLLFVTMYGTKVRYYIFFAAVIPEYSYLDDSPGNLYLSESTRFALRNKMMLLDDKIRRIKTCICSPGITIQSDERELLPEDIVKVVEEVAHIAEDMNGKKIVV